MSESSLADVLRLWKLPGSFLLQALDGRGRRILSIGRPDGHVTLTDTVEESKSEGTPLTVYGLMGIIELLGGPYVVVITQREQVGTYRGSKVFMVKGVSILACNANLGKLTSRQRADEEQYLKMIRSAVTTTGLYFSYGTDITTNIQRVYSTGAERRGLPMWQQADLRFLWNRHLLEPAIGIPGTESFLLPIMQGSFQSFVSEIKGQPVGITLVARRSIYRIGTRLWRRGADGEGAVANFVETEQILEAEGALGAYVQLRGSVPLLWEQIVDLKYKPKIRLLEADTSSLARHFRDLKERYGPIVALDLVNQKGSESKLGSAYAAGVESLKDETIKYVAFDFHKQCENMRFDRLHRLYDEIEETLGKFGFFLAKAGHMEREQKGVARTNCMDCLDRTNVTQSLLGKKALEMQLKAIGLFEKDETVVDHIAFNTRFKIMWANHGDDISRQYSGTGALKGDFVRYGERSMRGVLQDGVNSAFRYFLNNFRDGLRQDGLDLVTGHVTVNKYGPSPFDVKGGDLYANFPLAIVLFMTGIGMALYSFTHVGTSYQSGAIVMAVGWIGFSAVIGWILRTFGRNFTSRPKLNKTRWR